MRFHNAIIWILGFVTAEMYYADNTSGWVIFLILSLFFVFNRDIIWSQEVNDA